MIFNPLVSVLLPVYNGEKDILAAVNSILNQSYQEFELIVIDDSSSDRTLEILSRISDKRLKVYKNETNLQLANTLNKGIKLCKGKYVARMDADDISFPNRLELQVSFLENYPDYLLVGSAYIKEENLINKGIRRQVIKYETLKSKFLFGNNICHPSVMINRSLWVSNNLSYDPSYKYAQDFDLWTRTILTLKMANLPQPLIIYRRNSDNSNTEKSKITNDNFKRASIRYIQNTFKDISECEAKQLYAFFKRPTEISFRSALYMYIKSFKMSFQPREFDRMDFFLRINNQLLKNLLK